MSATHELPELPEPVDFDGLYREHRPRVYRLMLRLVRNAEEAHDLTHETFLRAWRYREQIDPEQNVSGLLTTIARRLAARRLDRRRLIAFESWDREVPLGARASLETPEQAALRREAIELVHRILPRLPWRCRLVLVWRYEHGLSHAAVGERLGMSRNSVGPMLSRAHRAFRAEALAMGAAS